MIKLTVSQTTGTINCRERNRLVTSPKSDAYDCVDIKERDTLILACHFCNENDDDSAKNWYKSDRLGLGQGKEVVYDMKNEEKDNRVILTTDHDLVVYNFTENDTGLYYCKRYGSEGISDKFSFLVDIIISQNSSEYVSGNVSKWKDYHDSKIHPINEQLKKANSKELAYLKHSLNLTFEVTNHWGSWGECDACFKPQGEGTRKKFGYCRVKILNKAKQYRKPKNKKEEFLMNASEMGCGSKKLMDLIPEVSLLAKIIPYFIQEDKCDTVCGKDKLKQFLIGKGTQFKYRKTYVLQQDAHLIIVCPESSIDSSIVWRRNGKVIKTGYNDDHVLVDSFNSLYLTDVTPDQEGNYTCYVGDMRMQQVKVFVVKKSQILTKAFVRYLGYLAFILSLTLSCYCAGLVITFNRRRYFLTFQELKQDEARGIKHNFLF
ncbi:unnamed protein product [Brassicogethes aeneus]|uniref:Ig-like domain-containing protein n=1 Tax=Brassicogethes aeneus TaxID=1431903 RepID=A0A9P0B7M8_BRAAE|nr:unnamed protein product [Brassicogethes aeneus]